MTATIDVVNARDIAYLLDVTTQRVYQLDNQRARGERPDFPAPLIPGWWHKPAIDHYALTRRRTPGPVPQ